MKRYDFFDNYGNPRDCTIIGDGDYVLHAEAEAEVEALRTSYVTLECQYARLMDSFMAQKAENMKLQAGLQTLRHSHRVCEDCWYSCPESGECCDEREKECNCGAKEHNAKIDALLASPSEAKGDTPDE